MTARVNPRLLGVDVTAGCGAALRGRRGADHADVWPGADGTGEANFWFKR